MKISKKIAIRIAAAILAVLVVGWLVWKQTAKKESASPAANTSTTLEQDEDKDLSQLENLKGNVLEGTLKLSNNSQRGNLMLEAATTTVYIYTSRDYSGLVGKQVKVLFDGTLEDFRLGDIVEK